jgi:hypothetical protein
MQSFLLGQGSFGTDRGYACMDDFVITRSWILQRMACDVHAEQVTLSGDQMRALLAAAYNGLRPVLVTDRTPSVVELAARRGPV